MPSSAHPPGIQVQFSVSIISAHAFSVRHRFNEVQQAERERERQRQQRQSRLWLGDGHTFLGAAAPPLAEHPDQAGLMLERFNVLNARQ